jgi:alginate O-acetyltransferase complex protein AlgI
MLFNSIEYLIFFPLVVVLYFSINTKWRWALLLLASYFFYAFWKVEYLVLIMGSTLVDYYTGLKMSKIKKRAKRKKYLILSIVVNLAVLVGFKYFNFFSENLNFLFADLRLSMSMPELQILLPVGISFYTFQTMSYSIDVYRGVTKAENHLGRFALYVSFFPQLVAGPIERSNQLLPQFKEKKSFNPVQVISGLKLMLWGFFKKIVIADRIGIFVSSVYENPEQQNGLPAIIASILFMIQLYCDFSAYTDIARGSARVMGYDLMINFRRPFVARSIADFWTRWHISLTTWFRDYLYFSLPDKFKNRISYSRLQINIIITFLLMGLWHGANWTFLFFGLIHGIFLVLEDISKSFREKVFQITGLDQRKQLLGFLGWLITFALLTVSGIFFRSANISDGFRMLAGIFNFEGSRLALATILSNKEIIFVLLQIILLFWAEWYHDKKNLVQVIGSKPIVIRWGIYAGFIFYIITFGIMNNPQNFIYFQF